MTGQLHKLTAFTTALWMSGCFAAFAAGYPQVVYVNEFHSQNLRDPEMLSSFTNQFQAALIQTRAFRVVDRQNLARSVQHCKAESVIGSLNQVSMEARDCLKRAHKADGMIFGSVSNDTRSNDIVVTVTVQGFDLTIHAQQDVQIRADRVAFSEIRKSKMEELVKSILPREGTSTERIPPVNDSGRAPELTGPVTTANLADNTIYQVPPGWQEERLQGGVIRLTPVSAYATKAGGAVILIMPGMQMEKSFRETFEEVVRSMQPLNTQAVRAITTEEGFDVLFMEGNIGRNYGTMLNPQIAPLPFKLVAANSMGRFESVLLTAPYMYGNVEQAFDYLLRSLDYRNHREARGRSGR